jgi:HEAT repeat protein
MVLVQLGCKSSEERIAECIARFKTESVSFFASSGEPSVKDVREAAEYGRIAIPQLIEALKHKNESIRCGAVQALGLIAASESISPIAEVLLKDPSAANRRAAANALGEIDSNEVVGPLLRGLRDACVYVRLCSASALGKKQRSGAEQAISKLLSKERDEKVRVFALAALYKITRQEDLFLSLTRKLLSRDVDNRLAATWAVYATSEERFVPSILESWGITVEQIREKYGAEWKWTSISGKLEEAWSAAVATLERIAQTSLMSGARWKWVCWYKNTWLPKWRKKNKGKDQLIRSQPSTSEIERLVEQLRSESHSVRMTASKKLTRIAGVDVGLRYFSKNWAGGKDTNTVVNKDGLEHKETILRSAGRVDEWTAYYQVWKVWLRFEWKPKHGEGK